MNSDNFVKRALEIGPAHSTGHSTALSPHSLAQDGYMKNPKSPLISGFFACAA